NKFAAINFFARLPFRHEFVFVTHQRKKSPKGLKVLKILPKTPSYSHNRILEVSMSGNGTIPTNAPVNAYHTGLVEYWAGRPQTSIEYITATLAEDPDHPYMLPMYRLWIELLADQNDKSSLR